MAPLVFLGLPCFGGSGGCLPVGDQVEPKHLKAPTPLHSYGPEGSLTGDSTLQLAIGLER